MKKVLVIGSSVVDVIINVEHLPKTQEDVHVLSQHMSLGGCAYNVSDMIRHFRVPYTLFSPVGTGAYGDFVRSQFKKRGIVTPIPSPETENGCCYCFVEASGERTFISYHGAEYLFQPEWFDQLENSEYDSVYICGLEIEESTGNHIVEFLEAHPEYRIYFAPGPRITKIRPELLSRLFALHPVLHLNEEEVLAGADFLYDAAIPCCRTTAPSSEPSKDSESSGFARAAEFLHGLTGSDIIVTLGSQGAYYLSSDSSGLIESIPAIQKDTIGAGDSHIGAVIAAEKLGYSLQDSIRIANRISARVVETAGALLSDDTFRELAVFDYRD